MFYPSKVGQQFGFNAGPDQQFDSTQYWRTASSMRALQDKGHDPLQLLVDRAHHYGMEFVASLRMGGFDGVRVNTVASTLNLNHARARGRIR